MSVKWITLFSQTGSEIKSLSEELMRYPDLIITNNTKQSMWDHNLDPAKVLIMSVPEINSFLLALSKKDVIVTLHGYLRILPANVCEHLEIYNGHPADIVKYPELKGKDPQERIWEGMEQGKYEWIGSVIHRCTAELDAGKIVSTSTIVNNCINKESVYNTLKQTSLESWKRFLESKL